MRTHQNRSITINRIHTFELLLLRFLESSRQHLIHRHASAPMKCKTSPPQDIDHGAGNSKNNIHIMIDNLNLP